MITNDQNKKHDAWLKQILKEKVQEDLLEFPKWKMWKLYYSL